MSRWIFPIVVTLIAAGCGNSDILGKPQLPPPDGEDLPWRATPQCKQLNRSCPGVDLTCPSDQVGICLGNASNEQFDAWCAVESSGNYCTPSDEITAAYRQFCALESCMGDDYDACIARGEAACQSPPTCEPGPAPQPCNGSDVRLEYAAWCGSRGCEGVDINECIAEAATGCGGGICDALEELAGHCPGYSYSCQGYPEAQSQCLLSLLESLSNPCVLFYDLPVCGPGGTVTDYGDADCSLQQCFGLSSHDACYANYDALCDWVTP